MKIDEMIPRIREDFPEIIIEEHIENGNEIYLTIKPENIGTMAYFLNLDMGLPLATIFASDERILAGSFAIYYAFSNREAGFHIIIKTFIDEHNATFISITPKIHAASRYEREIKDLFGLIPVGHPEAKRLVSHGNWPNGDFPLRKDFDRNNKPDFVKHDIKFTKIKGQGVFEVPVGPVHAGIIEPGHFRFSLAGEPILNLEAQLYFVHKGIEKMCEGESVERCLYVSERISGDETFANSFAYCQAIEKIAGIDILGRNIPGLFLPNLKGLPAIWGT